MRTRATIASASLLISGVLFAGEPSLDPPGICRNPILGIIEGPDPITGRCLWDGLAASDPAAAERETRASVAFDPRSGRPVVVWAAAAAGDHDVALEEWRADGSRRIEYLTASLADDVDPRAAFAEDGALLVAWWRRGEGEQVLLTRRDPVSGGWSVDAIVAENGRRPALALHDGRAWLVYERDGAAGGHELVAAAERADGTFARRLVLRVPAAERLAFDIAIEGGRPWLVWHRAASVAAPERAPLPEDLAAER